jgi:hypothetical protein
MPPAVTPADSQRLTAIAAAQPGRRRDQQPGQARRQIVGQVIHPGRSPAETLVALIAIADHAVERVDRLVNPEADRPAQGRVAQWRDDAIVGVLRHGFNASAVDRFGGERRGIPANDER